MVVQPISDGEFRDTMLERMGRLEALIARLTWKLDRVLEKQMGV